MQIKEEGRFVYQIAKPIWMWMTVHWVVNVIYRTANVIDYACVSISASFDIVKGIPLNFIFVLFMLAGEWAMLLLG